MSTPDPPAPLPASDFISTDELVRRAGAGPVVAVNELVAEDPFSSDEEYEEFLADLYASRRASTA